MPWTFFTYMLGTAAGFSAARGYLATAFSLSVLATWLMFISEKRGEAA